MALGAALIGRHIRGDLGGGRARGDRAQGLGLAGPALLATLAFSVVANAAELVAMLMGGVLVTAAGSRATLLVAGALPALVGPAGVAGYARVRTRPAPVEI